ncbi:cytochrome c family protein [Novosphingobium terrae]|uniref:cytochrome C n=1 Tax=Novosphingobium terrae TaxID=2726189 RepID=UPI001980052B|nr:cytochrome C [Novosphingobium terrae]
MIARTLILPLAGLLLLAAGRGGAQNTPGADAAAAHVDYMLKCQGCHRPDGTGDMRSTPPLAGEVARFLAVPGGREFLGQVPGVATTDLDDVRLARLLNWTLYRFDAGHLPKDFKPYTAQEIGRLRATPLRLERVAVRDKLLKHMNGTAR